MLEVSFKDDFVFELFRGWEVVHVTTILSHKHLTKDLSKHFCHHYLKQTGDSGIKRNYLCE